MQKSENQENDMSHLTLQEVIDKINQKYTSLENRRAKDDCAIDQVHRPEFYIPRITRRLARFIFST
jgi:hypothetical protein